jgi:hypothetical protein
MFNRLLQWFQSLTNGLKTPDAKPKRTNNEEGKFSFLGIKISYINPSWKTVFLAVIFLLVVLSIIYGLREYVLTLKALLPEKNIHVSDL